MSVLKACGNDPYDKEYGIAVSALGENFSPYERTNQLLKQLHDTPYTCLLYTSSFKKNGS